MEISAKETEVRPNTISDVKVDASFRKIAKNAICFHIWKIDEDRLEAVPKLQYGTFYDDAAYIIYAAGPLGHYVQQDTIIRETKAGTQLDRYIHFWLGEKVSEQKRSNVAHKIQELDSYFGNVATEYRETQDNESTRFLSYFKRGITIRSGVLTLSPDPNRLYQLRGRKWLRCIEMEEISWDHFASNYVMLLQTTTHLFMWIGRSSSSIERRDAISLASRWRNAATTATELIILDDGYEQSMPEQCKRTWNSFLPLSKRAVSQSAPPAAEQPHMSKIKIYKCGYRANRLHLDQLDVVIPTRDDLSDSTAVYVLDAHAQGIWLWVGKEVKVQESTGAMGNGRAFVKKKKYPYSTPVIRVVEGHEPVEFQRLFPSWTSEWCDSPTACKPPTATNWGRFDSLTLCQRPKMAASTQLVDDGSGERVIYRITKEKAIEMPNAKVIMFTTTSSYVVRYTVVLPPPSLADPEGVGVHTIIYQWNGAEAVGEVMAKSERFAKSAFESPGAVKVMFVQMGEGDETPHFLQLFAGKLIILLNEKSAGGMGPAATHSRQNGQNGGANGGSDGVVGPGWPGEHFILKVHGDTTYNSKAVEVHPLSAMNSKECYVVHTSHVWVWCGQSSTGDTREVAKNVGALLGESSLVLEGKEPKEFWRSVASQMNKPTPLMTNGGGGGGGGGGSSSSNSSCGSSTNGNGLGNGNCSPLNGSVINGGYLGVGSPNGNAISAASASARPLAQLFLIWAQRASFCCQEIIAFEQSDLTPECAYILDAGQITYIWLGRLACTYEQEKYLKMALHFVETVVPIARRPTTAIAVVRQCDEPNVFKGFFETWNHSQWEKYLTYEQLRQSLVPPTNALPNGIDQVKTPTSKKAGNKGGSVGSVGGGNPIATTSNGQTGSPTLPPVFLNHQKDFDRHHKYPIATLQQEIDLLPPEVNPLKREVHLTHDDFVSIFNMSFWEFDELPGWRKQELKKKHKLF